MTIDSARRLLVFVVLCLAQVLVLGNIHLFDYATPLLFVYFVIIFPRNYPKWGALLWSFALGFCLDMFANTPGVTAASLTFAGMLQPHLIELFLPREASEDIKSSAKALGVWNFVCLATVITVVFCLLFFALESFSFFNWMYWLQCAGASAALTLLLIFALETIRS
jgi:rod shape-determining protein MreD